MFLNKMPVIWTEYLQVLMDQKLGTRTRRAFDAALQSLPATQHGRIWTLYTKFVKDFGVWQTAVKVYRRYLTFDPAYREEYSQYLLSINKYDEAVKQMAIMVNDDNFVSLKGTSKHALWLQLCDIISKHPENITRYVLDASQAEYDIALLYVVSVYCFVTKACTRRPGAAARGA